jgi:hypothetical protein
MQESDFTAYGSDGRVRATVEARRVSETSSAWAAEFRRNAIDHGRPAWATGVCAVITLDKLYVWESGAGPDAAPDHEIDARPILAPYLARIGATPETIESMAFELLVSWWLEDLSRSASAGQPSLLDATGLTRALVGTRLVGQAARGSTQNRTSCSSWCSDQLDG